MPADKPEDTSEKRQDNGGAQGLVFALPILLPAAPWTVDPDDRFDMEWNNHILSADGNTVCFMAHNPDDNTALENAARAIAAVPDLLAALSRIAELSVYAGAGSRLMQAGSIARSAIFKAGGAS